MQDLSTASARWGGGGGEKRKKTKIEKAVLCSSCFFSHFALIPMYSLHSHAVKFLIKKLERRLWTDENFGS